MGLRGTSPPTSTVGDLDLSATSTASHVKTPQRAVAVTVRVALRKVLGLDLRVRGIENLPKDPHIVAHNLVSPLDAFVVALAMTEAGFAPPVVVLDYELSGIPMLSLLMNSGAVQVDRSAADPGDDDPFGVATRALWDGRCVITAPEQVVSTSLEVLPIRSGPVRLGVATDAEVVPAAIFGAHRLFDETGKLRLRNRGACVGITFGHPLMIAPDTGALRLAQRSLQFDLEGLLARTLDDYPERDQGEAGATWWPASRGGGAPSLLSTLAATDAPTPTVELWADDRTVIQTRRAKLAGPAKVAPDVPEWNLDDDDDEVVDVAPAAPAAPVAEAPVADLPVATASAVAAAAPAQASTPELGPVPPREPLPDPVPLAQSPMTPRGVDGMLAFDLPGLPRKVLRGTRLEAQGSGRLAVFIDDTAVLNEVRVDRRPDKTLFTGNLDAKYRVASGDLVIDVPAGTRATLIVLRATA